MCTTTVGFHVTDVAPTATEAEYAVCAVFRLVALADVSWPGKNVATPEAEPTPDQ